MTAEHWLWQLLKLISFRKWFIFWCFFPQLSLRIYYKIPQNIPFSVSLHLPVTDRCCNSCDDVREAYRRRGWAFKNADTIEQCKREGFTQKMQEQKNEGCQVYGVLEVNKVSICGYAVTTAKREEQLLCFILKGIKDSFQLNCQTFDKLLGKNSLSLILIQMSSTL